MTQEEKQLLLKDLCGRLPYEPHIYIKAGKAYADIVLNGTHIHDWMTVLSCQNITIKPYLRPMSSMSEEEKKYISDKCGFSIAGPIRNECELIMPVLAADWLIDFYNEHHIDYRGLIPMGLALEAPKDMYNTK